jgi:hypothetical protein
MTLGSEEMKQRKTQRCDRCRMEGVLGLALRKPRRPVEVTEKRLDVYTHSVMAGAWKEIITTRPSPNACDTATLVVRGLE